ncbi:hypothetical protein FNU79_06830 [Deinococcus detaillensis]|uniref:Uncharacterized protein n=1 Tax=Deinococcus detaillensis TaxID=2592048 RepID=A0A553V1P4_9DEIO|nr:hypothetical protein [Deinococcus detaillensis]TSA86372.1 hypothetical protein FNU79_06830 [Deinococcus detaillensis]
MICSSLPLNEVQTVRFLFKSGHFSSRGRIDQYTKVLSLIGPIGPIGPIVEFEDYQAYREKTIDSLTLKEVLEAITQAKRLYPRFTEDIEVLAIEYVDFHPADRQIVCEALESCGLEALDE